MGIFPFFRKFILEWVLILYDTVRSGRSSMKIVEADHPLTKKDRIDKEKKAILSWKSDSFKVF